MRNPVSHYLAPLGFTLASTGGGCTAFRKSLGKGAELLLTAAEADAPESLSEGVMLGIYQNGLEMELQVEFPTLRDFLNRAHPEGLPWVEVPALPAILTYNAMRGYFRWLYAEGLDYHLEDAPSSVEFRRHVTPDQRDQMNAWADLIFRTFEPSRVWEVYEEEDLGSRA